jgi:hypothetical protein
MSDAHDEIIKYSLKCLDDYDWLAGRTSDSKQVLVGFRPSVLVAVVFSALGRFLNAEHRPVGPGEVAAHAGDIDDFFADPLYMAAFEGWAAEYGFMRNTIHVEKFSLAEDAIGIYDLPAFYSQFIENPCFVKSESERQEWFDSINKWRAERRFVFRWGKEYWMDISGDVTDT